MLFSDANIGQEDPHNSKECIRSWLKSMGKVSNGYLLYIQRGELTFSEQKPSNILRPYLYNEQWAIILELLY